MKNQTNDYKINHIESKTQDSNPNTEYQLFEVIGNDITHPYRVRSLTNGEVDLIIKMFTTKRPAEAYFDLCVSYGMHS